MRFPHSSRNYTLPAGLAGAAVTGALAGFFLRGNGGKTGPAGRDARTVRDVMVDDVLTIDASASILEAAQLMRDANVGVLPVVDLAKLRGIVTDRDLVVRGLANGSEPGMTSVADCASWDIVCARPESTIDEAMEVMAECRIGRLPVVDTDNRVIGIVTLSSLALRSPAQEEALETAQAVSRRSSRSS